MNEDQKTFNSHVEAGVRIISLLNSYYPLSLDFESLVKTDYIIVNSGEFNGPESLHPYTPNRIGALATRRETVRLGLNLMRKFGLIELSTNEKGIFYSATQNTQPYLKLMKSCYSKRLIEIGKWLAQELRQNDFEVLDSLLSEMTP